MRMAIFGELAGLGRKPLAQSPKQLLGVVLLATLSVNLGGCITDPKDSDGNKAEAHKLLGVRPGAGELPDITRNTTLSRHYERMMLPDGSYGMVLCTMDMVYLSQAQVDNLDADTMLTPFKAFGLVGAGFEGFGEGTHAFGISRKKYDEAVRLSGNLTQNINKTTRKIVVPPTAPDPE
jgi:hypothetical protein